MRASEPGVSPSLHKSIAVLHANIKGNIGDFAILHAVLRDLKQKLPDRAIDVFSHGYYEADELRLEAFRNACDVEFNLAGKTYFPASTRSFPQLIKRYFGLWPAEQDRLIADLAARSSEDACRFARYEAVFIAGGEHWGGTTGGISMFGTLNAVHRHNDRIFAYPFSVNPRIRNFNSAEALQHRFRQIRLPLLVRDSQSKALLDELGIESTLGADCAYSLQPLADDILPIGDRDPTRVILSVTGNRKDLALSLRLVLQRCSKRLPEMCLMTTCAYEDGQVTQEIAHEFGLRYYSPATWQEAVGELKSSSLMITNRLHGLILGSLANTPLLPVGTRKKALSFAKDSRVPHIAFTMADITPEIIERCLRERETILDNVIAYKLHSLRGPYSPVSAPVP